MTILSHLGYHRPPLRARRPARPHPAAVPRRPRASVWAEAVGNWATHQRVYAVQRLGAVTVAGMLLVFGVVGLTSGVPFLATHGQRIAGLSTNGLLSTLSVVVAGILVGAAVRGPRIASTVMMVLGVLFLLSALVNLAVLGSIANLLAFQFSNVVFSVVVGLVLLLLGAYGRVSGHLPADSPYAHAHPLADEPPELPSTAAEIAAEAAMRAAEISVVQHTASEDQRRRVQAMAAVRTRADRRRVWMGFDRADDGRARSAVSGSSMAE